MGRWFGPPRRRDCITAMCPTDEGCVSVTQRRDYFELRRPSDRLVYQFDHHRCDDGRHAYKRRDGPYWSIRDFRFG